MKKLYSLMLATLMATSLTAQIDTLEQYFNRATGFNLETATNGYKFGTAWLLSSLITDETGLHYDGVGNATVIEVLVWFGVAEVVGNADNISAIIYTVTSDSMPDTEIGSGSIATSAITASPTNPTWTSIPITTGGGITSNFFVSLEYAGADDTLAIMTSDPNSGDGQGEKRMRQRELAFGMWRWVESIWFSQYDADAMILPVVDLGNSVYDIRFNGLQVNSAHPNPANDRAVIDISLDKSQEVGIKVFDLAGKVVYESTQKYSRGRKLIEFDTSVIATGNYYFTISTEGSSMTSKLVIAH